MKLARGLVTLALGVLSIIVSGSAVLFMLGSGLLAVAILDIRDWWNEGWW